MGRAVLPVCRALNCCEQTWCMYIIIVTIKHNIHNIQLWLFVVKILNRNLNLKRVEITYILSDMARRLPSTLGFCDITTLNNPSHLCLFWLLVLIQAGNIYFYSTWNLLMSLGLPAFFRQFWLHFRKNFRKNLDSIYFMIQVLCQLNYIDLCLCFFISLHWHCNLSVHGLAKCWTWMW